MLSSEESRWYEEASKRGVLSAEESEWYQEAKARGLATFKDKPAAPKGGVMEKYMEPALTIGSGMIAEPLSGLAGIAQGLNPFAEQGAGADAVRSTREALTYQPRTQAGKSGLLSVGEFMEPVTSGMKQAETRLGDKGAEQFGPLGGAFFGTIPAATSMMLGAGGLRPRPKAGQISKSATRKLLSQAAPDVDDLKKTARGIYSELDDAGAVVNPSSLDRLGSSLATKAAREGFHPKIHPKVSVALDEFKKIQGQPQSLSQIDTLRKITRSAAKSLEPDEVRIGSMLIDDIDNFLDNIDSKLLIRGSQNAGELGSKFRDARQLWHRAKKSELLDDAFEKAQNQASGFENGIRVQFRSILNNKKKMRGFSAVEKKAMQDVVRGGTAENIAKKIGRLGFGEGQATSMLMGSLGVAGGAAVGGPAGAVAVPLIGQLSRNLAQKMTRGNAALANSIIKAGKNGQEVVKAYMASVPKKQRSVSELTELLKRSDVDLSKLRKSAIKTKDKLIADSVFFADFLQQEALNNE